VYGANATKFQGVSRWGREFETGRMSVTDSSRSGMPSTSNRKMNAQRVDAAICADRRVKLREMSTEMGISYAVIFNIVHVVL
jgi:hypothetical protein